MKLRNRCLFSNIYTNKDNLIVKELEVNPKLKSLYEFEIRQQMSAASEDLQVGLPIQKTEQITKNLKQYLLITYTCGVDCVPLLEIANSLTQANKIEICQQILAICVFIEKTKITHGNIKPSNVFLFNNKVYLSDFGSSRTFFKNFQKQYTNEAGRKWKDDLLFYQCPEYLQLIQQNPSLDLAEEDFPKNPNNLVWADIWSLGIIALELFEGRKKDKYGLQLLLLEKQLSGKELHLQSLNRLLLKRESPNSILEDLEKQIITVSQRSQILQQSLVNFNRQSMVLQDRFVPPANYLIMQSKRDFLIAAGLEADQPPQNEAPRIIQANSFYLPPIQQAPAQKLNIKLDQNLLNPLAESLNELMAAISRENKTLKDFLNEKNHQTDSIPSLNFIKQLNANEIDQFIEKLKSMLAFHEGRQTQRQEQRIKDIKKCMGNLFLAECRKNALLTLDNQSNYPENEIIYFMNTNELLYLQNSNNQLSKRMIKEYLELQNKIETNNFAGINNLELLNIEELNQFETQDETFNSERLICKKNKELAIKEFSIEQFPYNQKLYNRSLCDKFIETGDDKYLLSKGQLTMLNINAQEEYKLRLLQKVQNAPQENRSKYLLQISILHDQASIQLDKRNPFLQRSVNKRFLTFFNYIYQPDLNVFPECHYVIKKDFPIIEQRQNYTGQEFAKVPHGLGILLQGKDIIYYGYFCLGNFVYGQSFQMISEKNFVSYTCSFQDYKKHGKGRMETYISQNQEFFKVREQEGYFEDGKMEGEGWLRDVEKKLKYVGSFQNNLLHGSVQVFNESQPNEKPQILQFQEGNDVNQPKKDCSIM